MCKYESKIPEPNPAPLRLDFDRFASYRRNSLMLASQHITPKWLIYSIQMHCRRNSKQSLCHLADLFLPSIRRDASLAAASQAGLFAARPDKARFGKISGEISSTRARNESKTTYL